MFYTVVYIHQMWAIKNTCTNSHLDVRKTPSSRSSARGCTDAYCWSTSIDHRPQCDLAVQLSAALTVDALTTDGVDLVALDLSSELLLITDYCGVVIRLPIFLLDTAVSFRVAFNDGSRVELTAPCFRRS